MPLAVRASIHRAQVQELTQVFADVTAEATLERGLRALGRSGDAHSRAKRRLFVLERDPAMHVHARGALVQAANEWLVGTAAESEATP